MQNGWQTLLFALVGIPLVTGILLRIRTFENNFYWRSINWGVIIYGALAVGLCFQAWHENILRGRQLHLLLGLSTYACVVLWRYVNRQRPLFGWTEAGKYLLFGAIIALIIGESMAPRIVIIVFIATSFVAAGAAFAIAGPVVAGFNVSALLYVLVFGKTLEDMFFWKDFFDFFHIERGILTGMMLIATTAFGAVDFYSYIKEHVIQN